MVYLYPASAPDYTKNGVPLHPTKAEVTYQDGGRWELDITLPVGENEHTLIDYGMHILSSVAPYTIPQINMGTISYWKVPDNSAGVPLYKTLTKSVSYQIWDWTTEYHAGDKVTCPGWGNYQCTQYDGSTDYIMVPPYNSSWWTQIPDKIPAQVITTLSAGTQLTKLGTLNSTYMTVRTLSGLKGYVQISQCEQVGNDEPYVIPSKHITMQPFEVRQIRKDQSNNSVTVHCVHDSYDLGGALLGPCAMKDATPQTALEFIGGAMQRTYDGEIITNISSGSVSADWSWKNAQSAILDPKDGLVKLVNGYTYRDGKNVYIVPETASGTPSYEVLYGANMKSVIWTGDTDALATRIYPVAKKANGQDLTLPEMYVETERTLPFVREKMIRFNGTVGQRIEQADGTIITLTESYLIDKMRTEAGLQFTRDHVDQPVIKLDLDFEHMPDTVEYAQYTAIKNAEPHTWLLVRHGPLGIDTVIRMSGYKWDAILDRYLQTSYGQIGTGATIASYQLGNGVVSGSSIRSGSVSRSQIEQETADHWDLAFQKTDDLGNIMRQAGMYLDANGLLVYAEDADTNVASKLQVTADEINSQVVKKATVYRQWTDPTLDSGNTVRAGDIWIKTNSIRTHADMGAKTNSQLAVYQYRNMYGSQMYVRTTSGTWELQNDDAVTVEQGTEIVQNKEQISLNARKVTTIGEETAQLKVTASEISATVTRVTADQTTMQGQLSVQADKISLVVGETTGGTNYIKSASIVASVNSSGSSVIISADHIDLNGYVKATDITADYIASKIAAIQTLTVNSISSERGGVSVYSVGTTLYTQGGVSCDVPSAIWSLRISKSGTTCTLQRKRFQDSSWVDVGSWEEAS